jgi:very-short-patch-repair endonuclease
LPIPIRQQIRLDSAGRRRYLDATLKGPDGREVGVEIDGAVHMVATQWWQDVERDNELRLSGDLVLHFPSVALYLYPERVADQLLRALGMR